MYSLVVQMQSACTLRSPVSSLNFFKGQLCPIQHIQQSVHAEAGGAIHCRDRGFEASWLIIHLLDDDGHALSHLVGLWAHRHCLHMALVMHVFQSAACARELAENVLELLQNPSLHGVHGAAWMLRGHTSRHRGN